MSKRRSHHLTKTRLLRWCQKGATPRDMPGQKEYVTVLRKSVIVLWYCLGFSWCCCEKCVISYMCEEEEKWWGKEKGANASRWQLQTKWAVTRGQGHICWVRQVCYHLVDTTAHSNNVIRPSFQWTSRPTTSTLLDVRLLHIGNRLSLYRPSRFCSVRMRFFL